MGVKTTDLEIFSPSSEENLQLTFVEEGVQAGFPSPAPENTILTLDLNKELIQHPAATFYARVVGNSMIDAGVNEGDILIIDRSIEPQNGHMVVCFVDGEFTLKFIRLDEKEKGIIWLIPANPDFPKIKVTPENEFMIWGVVSYTIKKRLKK